MAALLPPSIRTHRGKDGLLLLGAEGGGWMKVQKLTETSGSVLGAGGAISPGCISNSAEHFLAKFSAKVRAGWEPAGGRSVLQPTSIFNEAFSGFWSDSFSQLSPLVRFSGIHCGDGAKAESLWSGSWIEIYASVSWNVTRQREHLPNLSSHSFSH